MAIQQSVTPANLGNEFDLGVIEANKVHLNLGDSLTRDALTGVLDAVPEVDNTYTLADLGQPAPAGKSLGYDPATGDMAYVDDSGNWAKLSTGGITINNTMQTKFVHNGNTANSTWLRHEFDGNKTSNTGPFLVPFNCTIAQMIAQGRNVAQNKDIVIFINDVASFRFSITALSQMVAQTNISVVAGDRVGIRIEDVGNGGGWDDPIVWLFLS